MIEIIDLPKKRAVTLDMVKAYLKVSNPSEDRLLLYLIKAAEDIVSRHRGHYALEQTLRVTAPLVYTHQGPLRRATRLFYQYPFVSLPVFPIKGILGVTVESANGKTRDLEEKRWSLGKSKWPGRLNLRVMEGLRAQVDLVVGYGDDPESVPASLTQDILHKVLALYDKREDLRETLALFPRKLSL